MKRTVWVFAAIPIASALFVLEAQSEQSKPRVYVTDSTSWEMSGGWGESGGAGGGSVRGGARPQTAEIIKTFGERCPDIVVNNKKELADFVVILDHEGGKGIARKRNKIAVFNRNGDSIFSGSTRSLGNSVKDACDAIVNDFEHNPRKAISSSAETLHESTPASAAAPTQAALLPASPTATAEPTTLAVRSTPEGADITVDGKYKGSTPSSLRVEAGDRSVSVEKPGFKKWQHTVSIDAGSNIRLDMTLEPDQSANIVQVPSNPPISVKQPHDATPVPAQSTNIVQVPSNPPISAKQPHDATPVPAQSTNIAGVPFNPPVSATQPHEAAQIVPPSSDIQKRQPTGPATGESAIKPIKSGAGTAQISGEQGMTGSFEGEVRNETLGVTAGYEITVREENGGIYGCSTVQAPLSGSGGFNGSVNGSRVVFETEGKKFHIRFIGELQGDEMKGTYTVLSTSERGGFVLKRTNYNAPPFGFDTKKCRKD